MIVVRYFRGGVFDGAAGALETSHGIAAAESFAGLADRIRALGGTPRHEYGADAWDSGPVSAELLARFGKVKP